MGLLKASQQMKYCRNLRRVIEFIEHTLTILQHEDLWEFYPRLNLEKNNRIFDEINKKSAARAMKW